MQEFVITAPRTIEFRDYEDPPLAANEVRVKAILSSIKHGTEMNLYRGTTPFLDKTFNLTHRSFVNEPGKSFYPANSGSWLVGDVIEIGRNVTHFNVGDSVHGEMAHRPTNHVSEDKLFLLADDMSPEIATFTDPTIFALGACHDAQIKVGDNVAVFGLGALGLLTVQIAKMSGAEHIYAVDLIDSRLELARQFGATATFNPNECDAGLEIKYATHNKGVDVAIDISGAYPALQAALRSVHVGGLVVAAGYYHGQPQIDFGAEWHHNRPTLISSLPAWGNPLKCHPMWDILRMKQTALRLLENKQLIIEPMFGRYFDYMDAKDAYRYIDEHNDETLKTFLRY